MFETDYRTLSTMISPALFMTATGSLILSSNNRMARVVDRIRVLIDLSDQMTQPNAAQDYRDLRLEAVHMEMDHLHSRNLRIRSAMAMLYLAFTMFVGASLFIPVDLMFAHRIAIVPTILAVAGVCCLLWACINLFRESRTATHAIGLQIDFLNRLQDERKRQSNASDQSGF